MTVGFPYRGDRSVGDAEKEPEMVYTIGTNHDHGAIDLQEDLSDIAWQTRLLALNVAIESARAGDTGRCFAGQADALHHLSERIGNAGSAAIADNGGGDLHRQIESRIELLDQAYVELASMAEKITANARKVTESMQFEDVVSQVVVYSRVRAERLRSAVSRIEMQQDDLNAALVEDRVQIESKAE